MLSSQFLTRGHEVTVFDAICYGSDFLPTGNPRLHVVEADICHTALFSQVAVGHATVQHLACISNDASFELDQDLSFTGDLQGIRPLVVAAKETSTR